MRIGRGWNLQSHWIDNLGDPPFLKKIVGRLVAHCPHWGIVGKRVFY